MSEPASSGPGLKLKGRYVIQKELGRGGIGVVYLAHDEQLHSRPVVIKVLLDQTSGSDWFQKKFKGEIEALVRIDHPGVVGALDTGEMPDGKPFLVMQYVPGGNLRSMMNAGLLDVPLIADVVRQVGSALSAAHAAGVHHRDLKPENIMVKDLGHGERQVKIIDFGIATVRGPAEAGTQMTQVAGSVLYMAPEQLMGRPQAASDIYALAVIAYELLTGQPPFRPPSPYELLGMQRGGVQEKPSELRPGLSPVVDAMVLKGLSLEPRDRQLTARQLGDELHAALTAGAAHAPTVRAQQATEVVGTAPLSPAAMPTVVPPQTAVPQPTARSAAAAPSGELEMAHVLFTDIVGYSMLPMDHQRDVLGALQAVIQATAEYKRAQGAQQLVSLPTGDGMALVFFGDPTAAVRCAVEVALALKSRPEIRLRMGVHSGPVFRVADINANLNVAGGGINIAQRVMDSGDAGHILVSRTVADVVGSLSQWSSNLRDLGEHAVKHGVKIQLFNLVSGEAGNKELPSKLRAAAGGRGPRMPATQVQPSSSKALLFAIGGAVVVAAIVGGVLVMRPKGEAGGSTTTTTTAVAPAADGRELSYYLTVEKFVGGESYTEPRRLANEMLFGAGDRLRLTVAGTQPGYLYIVNEGPVPKGGITYNWLHPKATAGGGSAALSAGIEVNIPSAQSYFIMDKAPGTESLWLVFAKDQVPELEAVKGSVKPVDQGEIKDLAQLQGLRTFLDQHRGKALESTKDEGAGRTVLRSSSPVLVSRVKLEHM